MDPLVVAPLATRIPPTEQRTFQQAFDDFLTLDRWLGERGYADSLAAVEADEVGPEGLTDLLHKRAEYDLRDRAWERIEQALKAHELPAEADLRLLHIPP
jgi:hypothetical protein